MPEFFWVPHALKTAQKVVPVESGQRVLQALAKYQHRHFQFLFTGDKSWMFYADNHRTTWVASWEDIDELERPLHSQQKTILTILFNGTGEYNIAILPARQNDSHILCGTCAYASDGISVFEALRRREAKSSSAKAGRIAWLKSLWRSSLIDVGVCSLSWAT
jgi:hypothetical protein